MGIDNRISLELTAAEKAAIVDATTALEEALDGKTQGLTPEERHDLPKLGDKSLGFDEKCQTYMAAHPTYIPGFVDQTELAKDRKLITDYAPCLAKLAPLVQAMEDTVTQAYSDIYIANLAFYQNVRQAAKRGVPGADAIYQDLQERFPGRPKKVVPPTP